MEKTKNIAPHVMACKRCEGKGRIFYLDQGGAPLSAKCPVCNGSGRVKVQSKVITRIEPFVPGEDVDSQRNVFHYLLISNNIQHWLS